MEPNSQQLIASLTPELIDGLSSIAQVIARKWICTRNQTVETPMSDLGW